MFDFSLLFPVQRPCHWAADQTGRLVPGAAAAENGLGALGRRPPGAGTQRHWRLLCRQAEMVWSVEEPAVRNLQRELLN